MSFLVKGFTSWYAGKIGSRLSKLGASLGRAPVVLRAPCAPCEPPRP
jgi:hypothetical protein